MKSLRTRALRSGTLSTVMMLLLFQTASAEIPDQFKGLEVYPKEISKRDLVDSMKKISAALGVRCDFCHEMKTPGDFDSIDWASNKLEHKEVARNMMLMTGQINGKMLPEAPPGHASRVTCFTCHRGLPEPTTLAAAVLGAADEGGINAGISKYRELRKAYYGTGSFDFGPQALMGIAETLAQERKDLDGALAIMNLAVEIDADVAINYLMRGQIRAQIGQTDDARKDVEKALELEPENQHAKRMLDQLQP